MTYSGGTDKKKPFGPTRNDAIVDPEHSWLIDLRCVIGKPCCRGPIFDPGEPVWTHDLTEDNEDRFVRAAELMVRQAFSSARQQKSVHDYLLGSGSTNHGPHSHDKFDDFDG